MRNITSYLNEKLKSTQQTPANKADPKMSVKVSRARTTVMDSDYWTVEAIRTGPYLGDISLAARRRVPYGAPDSIYEIHVEAGIVKTSIRRYPDYFKLGWQHQFELGEGSAVAIAFNGNWQLYRRKWRIVTEEKPFIFWVDMQGVLWSQHWDLSETKRQIATSVVRVKAIRGWKNVNFPDKDQGVIVAYIKTDGKVYYSSYCQTIDYTYVWEPERQVQEFTGIAVSLNMFITNDFRMGFTIEDTIGNIHWLVTERNWAGMAIASETIKPHMEKSKTELIKVSYHDIFEPAETLKVITPYTTGIEHIFHDVSNKILWIKNIDNGSGDWGRLIQFETLYPLFEPQVANVFLEDTFFGLVIPVGEIIHLGGNIYQVSVSEETLVGMNNSQDTVRLTIKNLKTQLGLMMDDFSIEFTPVNLIPIEIPLPVVEEVWNE